MFTARLHELKTSKLWRSIYSSIDLTSSTSQYRTSQNIRSPQLFICSKYPLSSNYFRTSSHGKRERRCLVRFDQRLFSTFGRLEVGPSSVASELHGDTLSRPLNEYSISELHELMKCLNCDKQNACRLIYEIVEHLITVRKESINATHYAVLIRANASAYWGSAESVRDLLKEMDDLKIPKDTHIYHNALLALSIHPDYVLRMEILSDMKRLWLKLSLEGCHHLIIGLIRDRQYELAIERLEQMIENQAPIKPWLFDILMYQLCESEEYEEALSILNYRWDHRRNEIKSELWHFMMDSFGRGLFVG